MSSRITVSKKRIRSDLRRLGVARGDTLLVHSSLKSIGYVDGGAGTVVDALLLDARAFIDAMLEKHRKDPEVFLARTERGKDRIT